MVHLKQAFGYRAIPILAFVCLAFAVSACGEDEPQKQPYKGDDIEGTIKKKRKVKKGAADFVAKPEWDMVAPHFLKYVKVIEKEVHSKSVTWNYKDAFADHIEKFYPPPVETKPIIDLAKAGAEKKAEAKKEEPTIKSILAGITAPGGADSAFEEELGAAEPVTPLIKHALLKYNFRIIMTGVSNPEVVVEDPEGGIHVVHENDKIGLEGGYVSAILKHKVFVKMPDQPEPISVSLAPESLPDSFAKN